MTDHESDWQPRLAVGKMGVRSVNVKNEEYSHKLMGVCVPKLPLSPYWL